MSRNYQDSTSDAERDRDEGACMQVETDAERAARTTAEARIIAEHDALPRDDEGNLIDPDTTTDDTLLGVTYPTEEQS